jgi:hypothetical protein
MSVRRVIGVYDASGRPRDEIAEWIRARLGRDHCSLCAVTHSAVRMKPSWRRACERLPVAFELLHLRERSPELTLFTQDRVPCVVADTERGFVMLLDGESIAACEGDPSALVDAVEAALDSLPG